MIKYAFRKNLLRAVRDVWVELAGCVQENIADFVNHWFLCTAFQESPKQFGVDRKQYRDVREDRRDEIGASRYGNGVERGKWIDKEANGGLQILYKLALRFD